jgi:CRP-like cAMP-binding protein
MSHPDLKQIEILLKRLVRNTDRIATAMECGQKTKSPAKSSEDQRVALAVVAIARGASSFQEIADELGVSRCTVSRNPGIRRAMEAAVRDRRPVDREAAEEFRFENSR